MSGSFPRNRPPHARASGFTLLELLVVLALVSMLAAMVAPRLQRTYEAIARSGDRAETLRQLESLPLRARAEGRAIDAAAGDPAGLAPYLDLPEGWSVRPLDPLRIESTGFCHPARIRVDGGGGSETWSLSAPDCAVPDAP
jgi:prepilin-type N-terminal cleavage/methylation domain-containing protein